MDNESPDQPPRRKGGRPQKPEEVRRKTVISSAYTKEEESRLSALADSAGRAVSIYQREAALNGKVIERDKDSGIRISILRQILSEANYCHAELNKIEGNLAGRGEHVPAIISLREQTAQSLSHVNGIFLAVTILLKKEAGIDPG